MNYIDLLNHFWKINKEFSFTPNEKAVYFALLYKWNDLHRKNPFNFSNDHFTSDAGMSVNAMKKARVVLKTKGLIDFNSGDGRKVNTVYVINNTIKGISNRHLLVDGKVVIDDTFSNKKVSQKLSPNDTLIQKKVSPDDDYISKLIEERIPNIEGEKREEEEEEIFTQKNLIPIGSSSVYSSMDDVEFICLNQSSVWLEHMTRKLKLGNVKNAKKWVLEFFDTMKASGQDKRDLNDTRQHCYNWINIGLEKEKSSGKNEKGKAEAVMDLNAASTDYWDMVEQMERINQSK
ncbi:DUF7833 domain-containing protein [Pedobacter gandavensis]|uniref:DUF7833 domain-containing protein n=1 Tax=Pedobacter gandavensis TaxID=2679963 RepID=A0ABR6EU86_9SPHI|nr:hypothetical protein [Pedobacter gandavensis]MBB2148830.1 hypothetical protein [Pedobacter gandavensis]